MIQVGTQNRMLSVCPSSLPTPLYFFARAGPCPSTHMSIFLPKRWSVSCVSYRPLTYTFLSVSRHDYPPNPLSNCPMPIHYCSLLPRRPLRMRTAHTSSAVPGNLPLRTPPPPPRHDQGSPQHRMFTLLQPRPSRNQTVCCVLSFLYMVIPVPPTSSLTSCSFLLSRQFVSYLPYRPTLAAESSS
ncbi:hypothetical protein LY78DRAFT_83294 [Colletotrichum sublineola]|nr:hypothetical protein LY78DRAFT_83294 [Colletotrichum sublineola]